MPNSNLAKRIREIGLAERILPTEMLQQSESVGRAFDRTGAMNPSTAAPFVSPQTMQWGPGSTTRQRVDRAGNIKIFSVYASTAPSSGDAIITLTQITEIYGQTTVTTLTLPEDSQFETYSLNLPVPSGGWLLSTVTTANGASGVSMFVSISGGSQ